MRTAIASKIDRSQTAVGRTLARRGTDLLLAIEDGNALIQCQVSSAVAAAMLAPLKGKAVGQFRTLAAGLVEIDAAVTLAEAACVLRARDEARIAHPQLH
jgi:hypothetical protein